MAVLYLKTGGGNWTAAATWSATNASGVDSAGPPTAADDAIAELLSGNVTIDSGAVCRSFDTTSGTGSYGGTITHNAITFNIGDGTAGAGNVALKLNSGVTYNLSNATTSAITFKSTSSTQQTITTAGKTLGNIVINGAGSSYKLADNLTSSGSFTYTAGTTFDTTTASAVITLNGAAQTFTGGAKTYYEADLTGSGNHTIAGANTFTNFVRSGTSVKTDGLIVSANQTVTGNLNFNGNSATNRLQIVSDTLGTQRTFTITGATFTGMANVDFRDTRFTTGTTDLSAISGNSGDQGGNSGITFTTSATQTWSGTTSDSWSTNAWSGRVPLPQDDVIIAGTFSASQTITVDMPRIGRSITITADPASLVLDMNSQNHNLYGSLDLSLFAGTTSNTSTGNLGFTGRSAATFTQNSKVFGTGIQAYVIAVQMIGSSLTMNDSLTTPTLQLSNGTFDSGNFTINLTLGLLANGTNTKVLNMGSSTWNLTSFNTVNVWNVVLGGTTMNAGTSLIKLGNSASLVRTFVGGTGLAYYDIEVLTGGTGSVNFVNTVSFHTFTINAPKTVKFTAATTTTVTSFIALGSSGNLITISSITAATHTLSKASGTVAATGLSLTNSIATGASSTWYAGATPPSVDNGGNTGWIFGAAPGGGLAGMLCLMGVGK